MATLGGAGERARAAELCQRLQVVPDAMSERVAGLELSGQAVVTVSGAGERAWQLN